MTSFAPGSGSRLLRVSAPLLLALSAAAAAPGAASGQALPSHTATGITAGFGENAGRGFVRLLGRGGLVRDGASIEDPMEREVDGLAVAGGAILGGFTPYWTNRVIVPWVRKSMEFTAPDGRRLHYDASGVAEAILQSKWMFFRENRVQGTTRLGIQGRLFAPLGETEASLPTGELDPNSGGHLLFLSPDLQWIPSPWLLFEGSVQIPVAQDLNGAQLEHETRLQLGTRLRFSVFR